jgi:hypothetical protein
MPTFMIAEDHGAMGCRLTAVHCVFQTPQAQQTSTFVLPQGGADPLADMMSQLDQRLAGPHRQVP